MRRWNGWGDDANHTSLTPATLGFLAERIGVGAATHDAPRERVLQAIAAPRLTVAGFSADPAARLAQAKGQSYPDWLALRYGRDIAVADGVATPRSSEEAQSLLNSALNAGAIVIPVGGATSVVGHLEVPQGDRPVLNISLSGLNQLSHYNEQNRTAMFGGGTPGPAIEAQLAPHGMLLGHFPQSYEYSTVGGWVVTRSSGQQSLRYGRIEPMFHAGTLVTPKGVLKVGGIAASSAGQDLRQAVMGSEGRMGLLTEVEVCVRPLAGEEHFYAVFFPDWPSAVAAMRALTQANLGLSMLRLSNEIETETQLALAGHEKLIAWLRRYLQLRSVGTQPVMLLLGTTGNAVEVQRQKRDALALCKTFHGVNTGKAIGKGWAKNRFNGPYLRNSLWGAGYGADTAETCVSWGQVTPAMRAIEAAAHATFASWGERGHAFTHLSHVYHQGCSVYSTFVFRAGQNYEQDLARWKQLKAAVSEAVVAHQGTISHQHGVGRDHAPYLVHEKGELGLALMRAIVQEFDPQGRMNPGKLLP